MVTALPVAPAWMLCKHRIVLRLLVIVQHRAYLVLGRFMNVHDLLALVRLRNRRVAAHRLDLLRGVVIDHLDLAHLVRAEVQLLSHPLQLAIAIHPPAPSAFSRRCVVRRCWRSRIVLRRWRRRHRLLRWCSRRLLRWRRWRRRLLLRRRRGRVVLGQDRHRAQKGRAQCKHCGPFHRFAKCPVHWKSLSSWIICRRSFQPVRSICNVQTRFSRERFLLQRRNFHTANYIPRSA